MPQFEPDLLGTRATTRVFPKCEAILKCGKLRGNVYTKDDGKTVAMVGVSLSVVGIVDPTTGSVGDELFIDGEVANVVGEDAMPNRLYVHTDKAWRMVKQFLMAAFGYERKEEEKFNTEVVSIHKWFVGAEGDAEGEVSLGDGWLALEGQSFLCQMDIETREDPDTGETLQGQKYKALRPRK